MLPVERWYILKIECEIEGSECDTGENVNSSGIDKLIDVLEVDNIPSFMDFDISSRWQIFNDVKNHWFYYKRDKIITQF